MSAATYLHRRTRRNPHTEILDDGASEPHDAGQTKLLEDQDKKYGWSHGLMHTKQRAEDSSYGSSEETCLDRVRGDPNPTGDIGMMFLALMLHSRHLAKDAHRAVIENFGTLFSGRPHAEQMRIAESISPNNEQFPASSIVGAADAYLDGVSSYLENRVYPRCVKSGKCAEFSMNLWEAANSPDGCEAIKRPERMPCEATFPDNACQTSLLIDKAGLVEEMCPSAENACWMLGRLKVRTITTFDPNRAV